MMALRNIRVDEDPVLRKKAKKVDKFNPRLHGLLDDMAETMYAAPGVGLAAPQVGMLKRAIVFDIDENLFEMVNPVITKTEGEQIEIEGCLSVPGKYGRVERPEKITVEYQDRYGDKHILDAEGLKAVVICHETDHLDGKLFTDLVIEYLTPEELEESGEEFDEAL
jgi:peptide deformylase